jgi:hypothetical protein
MAIRMFTRVDACIKYREINLKKPAAIFGRGIAQSLTSFQTENNITGRLARSNSACPTERST